MNQTHLKPLMCLLMMLSFLMLLFSAAFDTAAAPTSSFSGKVIDKTGAPITDVNVMLSSGHDQIFYVFPWVIERLETDPDFVKKEMSAEYSDNTDAAGLFSITGIGEHLMLTLWFDWFRTESKYNFIGLKINGIVIDMTHPQLPIDYEGFPLSLVPGASIDNVEITVARRISIQGQVLLSDGTPLRNTQVSLSVKGLHGGMNSRTMLDNEGRFVKYVDRANTYTVELIYQGQKVASMPLKLEKGQHVKGVILQLPNTVKKSTDKVNTLVVDAINKYRSEGMWVLNPDTQHAYKRVRCATLDDALKQAKEQGAHLVAINNAVEQHWLRSVFGKNNNYWIGLKAGATQWDNGEPVIYTNLEGDVQSVPDDTVYTVLIGKIPTWELGPKGSPIREKTRFAILEKKNLIVK